MIAMAELDDLDVSLQAPEGEITIKRNAHGVPVVRARTFSDMYYGLGWVQAYDRPVQLELTRLVAKGVSSEHLPPSPDLIKMDKEMQRYDLWGFSVKQAPKVSDESDRILLDFCRGINNCLEEHPPPEFGLLGYNPEAWTQADCIIMSKIISLVGLDESQGWMKRFIVQMVKNGVSLARLKEIFTYMTEEPDAEYLEILKRVKLQEPIVPETVNWDLPRMNSSSNWAVSGAKTKSGKAMLCGSPDLDVSRLPAIWQEVVLRVDDFYMAGFTIPGLMALPVARTNHLAWSPTYGYMNVMDYFIEEVKEGKYRRGDSWVPFDVREEVIAVRGEEPLTVRYYECEHGVLMGEPDEDGYYLCLSWSMRDAGATTVDGFVAASRSRTVAEAMEHFDKLDFGAQNWVVADSDGNIGHVMSGLCPKPPPGWSGLLPIPGWDTKCNWKGCYEPEHNPRQYNPKEGFIGTANQDVNHLAGACMQNLTMPSDRSARIAELLGARDDHDLDSMRNMQYDVYAKHAEQFMPIIRPLLPDTENGNLLKEWDLLYSPESLGATLFENVYLELVRIVFGEGGMGREVVEYVQKETSLLNNFYGYFDQVLLREESLWFEGRSRDELYRLAISRGLDTSPVPYGKTRAVTMKNIVYGELNPDFNYGPIELRGCRGTPCHSQLVHRSGKSLAIGPSCRMITDFAEDKIYTSLPGGPTERPASSWYTSGVPNWLDGKYNEIEL
jgi:penicillin amidase